MDTAQLEIAASVARLLGAAISFLYLMLLLPHLGGFQPANLASPWYVAAILVALLWAPLLWLHARTVNKRLSALELTASFSPLVLMCGFWGLIFAVA